MILRRLSFFPLLTTTLVATVVGVVHHLDIGVAAEARQTVTERETAAAAASCTTCTLAPDPGMCFAAFLNWYYNAATGQCETFTYGGCGGNANRFESLDSCDEYGCGTTDCACAICQLPVEVGPCDAAFQRWYFNADTQSCETFVYGGCAGNGNNFESLSACQEFECSACTKDKCDVCELDFEVGPCEALVPSWYYNSDTSACESFTYGGCQGNDNNFESLSECQAFECTSCAEQDKCEICKLDFEVGPCEAEVPRWYYNSATSSCESFTYGGCQGNDNNFESSSACENFECSTCTTNNKCDTCELDFEVGPCEAAIPRWYFNSATSTCERFIYGGCQGNDNNFVSLSACQEFECTSCTVEDKCDVCELDFEVGPCDGAFTRWYYNGENGVCEPFLYGGCDGNDNNFESLEACQTIGCAAQCSPCSICSLPPVVGDCAAAIERWYFDADTQSCETFTYGGCGGNGNNFVTQSECEAFECKDCEASKCAVCELDFEVGPCEAAIPRWYYNSASSSCERFTYGGCGGNDNNFELLSACEDFECDKCTANSTKDKCDICELDFETGPCEALIPRWYYNSDTSMCESFTYGGCHGNENNFLSLSACQDFECSGCNTGSSDDDCAICELDFDTGPCLAAFPRWYYNSDTESCESFIYGGCGGNDNNFESLNECRALQCDSCGEQTICNDKDNFWTNLPFFGALFRLLARLFNSFVNPNEDDCL